MERKRREDCFFGVHFDFHASDDSTSIGANTTEEQIQYMLDTVQPDFVQCDSKGHPGMTSFETAVGTRAPGFARDNLKIWRDVTARAGIPLFLHYSGVFDMAAVRVHPEWAIVDAEGQVSRDYTSLRGGYSDGLLIPQLSEVIDRYDVDGVWIDGEAWAVNPDYSPAFLADAWHHRSDAFSSVASLIGIGGAMLGFPVLDSVAGVVICLFILKVAYDILKDAISKMLDTSCGEDFERQVTDYVEAQEDVICVDMLHSRMFGSRAYIDLEIEVDGSKSLWESHAIAERVHAGVEQNFPDIKHIMIHVNPASLPAAPD